MYVENENGQHSSSFIFVLIGSSSFFAGNMDNHKFGQIRLLPIAALERLKKIPIYLNGRNVVAIPAHFNWYFFVFAGKKDMHKSLDEFEIKPDPTIDFGVTCHWASENQCITLL